jgi:cell division protein FtsI (penicillin-binding protein 3)
VNSSVTAEMTDMMEAVVEVGTGTLAQIPGYTVAGKTGTAKKLVNGSYRTHNNYNASFAGFVPSRKPVFTIVVVVDSPHGPNGFYGGPVSAPIFRRIAAAALRQYGVAPTIDAPPPLLVARHQEQEAAVRERPTAGTAELPSIVTLAGAARGSASVFPDLRGLGARDALQALATLGLTAQINGTGIVVEQRPEAGTRIERGMSSTLWLERHAQP